MTCWVCLVSLLVGGCGNSSVDVAADTGQQSDSAGLGVNNGVTGSGQPLDDSPLPLIGPEGDSALSIGSSLYPMDAAVADIWGVTADHYGVDFTLTDGNFRITPTIVGGKTYNLLLPAQAKAVVFASMHSPGRSFSFDTYSHSAGDIPLDALAGAAYFNKAYVGIDTNQSGEVEPQERLQVVGGTMAFLGDIPDIEIRFSLQLEDGQLAEGHYTGLFDFIDRQ